MSDEYRKICALCNNGSLIRLTGDVLCEFEGVVEPEGTCRRFEINYLRVQPRRARKPDISKFTPEDFSIE